MDFQSSDFSKSEDSIRLEAPSDTSSAARPIVTAEPGSSKVRLEPHLTDMGEFAHGGMGSIHLVFDKNVLRHEAMKVPNLTVLMSPEARLRFLEEAQITGQLEHPNILPVYALAVDPDGGPRYFTMKLARGETFEATIRAVELGKRTGRELERLLKILTKVCEAVSFAHSRGVVHRDLKPDNVMVGTHGQVYVMDWGCALVLNTARPSETETDAVRSSRKGKDADGTILGTPAYMAPEQALGFIHEIDGRTDIYGLGGMLYRIITDVPPHRDLGDDEFTLVRAMRGQVPPPEVRLPEGKIAPELARIAMKALSLDKKDRYARVEDMIEDLDRFLRQGAWFATKTYAPGEIVLREGDAADTAFIILRGSASAFKTENGLEKTLRTMRAGDVFGEAALLTAQPRTASVVAAEELEVMIVTRESLDEQLSDDSWMGALVRTLATRFRDVDAQLSALRKHLGSELAFWIDAHLSYAGTPREDGGRAAPLSSLVARLTRDKGLTESDLAAYVAQNERLRLDADADLIVELPADASPLRASST